MKKSIGKMALSGETVRHLSALDLREIRGGQAGSLNCNSVKGHSLCVAAGCV